MNKKPKLIFSLFTISVACTLNGVAFAQAYNTKSAEDARIKSVSQVPSNKSEQPSGIVPGTTKDEAEGGCLKKGWPDSDSGSLCEVNYSINNGTISTGWINLGKVYFPQKRKDCKQKAIDNCRKEQKIKALLPSYAPVGSQNMQAICSAGRLDNIYFDTKVGNLNYTKDGYCSLNVKCNKPPCPPTPWTGYD